MRPSKQRVGNWRIANKQHQRQRRQATHQCRTARPSRLRPPALFPSQGSRSSQQEGKRQVHRATPLHTHRQVCQGQKNGSRQLPCTILAPEALIQKQPHLTQIEGGRHIAVKTIKLDIGERREGFVGRQNDRLEPCNRLERCHQAQPDERPYDKHETQTCCNQRHERPPCASAQARPGRKQARKAQDGLAQTTLLQRVLPHQKTRHKGPDQPQ